jgi:hypothetical protein
VGLEHKIESVFHMSPEVWSRHANPLSVWTRYAALPLLIIAVWSRVWIGWWSVLAIVAMLVWIWLNPRVFQRPASTRNWASKAVLGERVWLNRKDIPIPKHHNHAIRALNIITGLGGLLLIYGLIRLRVLETTVGTILVVLGKSWFLDRMVWLYDEMAEKHHPYRDWLY